MDQAIFNLKFFSGIERAKIFVEKGKINFF
jgi:hypothetical protein